MCVHSVTRTVLRLLAPGLGALLRCNLSQVCLNLY
jgi:hypothetical protein